VKEIHIMIVDDFSGWRAVLRSILEKIERYRIVGEAKDALEAIEMVGVLLPDIVLLDIGLPILNGVEAAPRIHQASPTSRIIFVTQELDRDVKATALAVGAKGYLLKSSVGSELEAAIETALKDNRPTALFDLSRLEHRSLLVERVPQASG